MGSPQGVDLAKVMEQLQGRLADDQGGKSDHLHIIKSQLRMMEDPATIGVSPHLKPYPRGVQSSLLTAASTTTTRTKRTSPTDTSSEVELPSDEPLTKILCVTTEQ